jgi:hypothetical protein
MNCRRAGIVGESPDYAEARQALRLAQAGQAPVRDIGRRPPPPTPAAKPTPRPDRGRKRRVSRGSGVGLGGELLAREAGEDQRPGNADAVCCRLPSPAAPPRAAHCGCENLGAEVPDGSATLVGYREREPGRLHLRAVLRGRTEGVCDAIAGEDQK